MQMDSFHAQVENLMQETTINYCLFKSRTTLKCLVGYVAAVRNFSISIRHNCRKLLSNVQLT